jgi:prepilin-type N-terminal cleavage/methylation domain-containing protein
MRHRRGFSLIETMIAVMALSFIVLCFGAVFPTASRLRSKGGNVTLATTLAHQKVEQLRGMKFADLTYSGLYAAGIIDASPPQSPFSISTASGLTTALTGGSGTLTLTDESTGLKRARVDISWSDAVSAVNSVALESFLPDMSDLAQ